MPETVRAIVLNYNQHATTLRAVAELRRSRGVALDPLVVDSASGTDDIAALRAGVHPDRLLLLTENRGYAGGMNAGLAFWRRIGGDAPVLLFTPDARIGEDVVRGLLDALHGDPRVAVAGPVVAYSSDPAPRLGAGGSLIPRKAQVRLIPEIRSASPYDVDWVEGCCMLVRPDVIADIGGLDERYFLYYEEIDLCHRVREAGWKVRVAPGVRVLHPKAAGQQPPHFYYYMTRNAYLFWRKSFGFSDLRPALQSLRATFRLALVAFGSLALPGHWAEVPARFRDLTRQLRGAWAGTRDHLRGVTGPGR